MSNDNLNAILKWLGTVLAFGVWGYFAYIGKTPVDGFVTALTAAVSGISVHAVMTKPTGGSNASPNP